MELRTAESKSLIRRKTVKVNTGAAAAGKARRYRHCFAPLLFFFFSSLFQHFVSVFFAFLNERFAHTLPT